MAVNATTAGLTPFGIYLEPMTVEFGWTRTEFSFGLAVMAITSIVLLPFVGWWIDREGARKAILAGSVALPAVMALFGFLSGSYLEYLALTLLLGLATSLSGASVVMTIPPQWFDRRLGLSLAIVSMGLGLGTAVMPVLAGYFVHNFGWRSSWFLMSVIVAVITIPNTLLFIRDNPDFRAARKEKGETQLLSGATFKQALSSPRFWFLAIPYGFISIIYTGLMAHFVPMAIDRGFTAVEASVALSAVGLSSIGSRLVTGMLLDRVHYLYVGVALLLLLSAGLLVLLSGQLPAGFALYAAAILVGVAVGGESDLLPFVLRRRFGMKAYARLYGIAFAFSRGGPIVGPILLGAAFDRFGSYRIPLIAFLFMSVLAMILFVLSVRGKAETWGQKVPAGSSEAD